MRQWQVSKNVFEYNRLFQKLETDKLFQKLETNKNIMDDESTMSYSSSCEQGSTQDPTYFPPSKDVDSDSDLDEVFTQKTNSGELNHNVQCHN